MGLLDLFRKKGKDVEVKREEPGEDRDPLAAYANMRVEVMTFGGRLLFVAKLRHLRGNTGELYQYSESDLDMPENAENKEKIEPIRVRIRGYYDLDKKAVYMEGTVTPQPHRIWKVEELVITGTGNDRAFFRLDTNLEATATVFSGSGAGDYPCRLLNISVGGARIAAQRAYEVGDKFLLKVRLLEDRDMSVMFCKVMRVIDKGEAGFEYGCQFQELNEADQDRITENMFAMQRKQRTGR